MSEQTPVAQADVAAPPRTYLVWAALAAAVLFLPVGIVAVFFAIRTQVLVRRGEIDRARRTSRAALAFTIVTVVVGVLVYSIVVGGLLALGAFSGT